MLDSNQLHALLNKLGFPKQDSEEELEYAYEHYLGQGHYIYLKKKNKNQPVKTPIVIHPDNKKLKTEIEAINGISCSWEERRSTSYSKFPKHDGSTSGYGFHLDSWSEEAFIKLIKLISGSELHLGRPKTLVVAPLSTDKKLTKEIRTVDEVTVEDYIDATNEIDKKVEVLVRTEQSFLRRELFNSHDIATCCICNSIMPIKFLVTAHIKKRSLCTDAEKRDYKNIVTPMCKFGCDELYERGFIAVHGGHVINIETPSDDYGHDYINEYLKKITGQKCNTYTPKSSGYFEWHYDEHKQSINK